MLGRDRTCDHWNTNRHSSSPEFFRSAWCFLYNYKFVYVAINIRKRTFNGPVLEFPHRPLRFAKTKMPGINIYTKWLWTNHEVVRSFWVWCSGLVAHNGRSKYSLRRSLNKSAHQIAYFQPLPTEPRSELQPPFFHFLMNKRPKLFFLFAFKVIYAWDYLFEQNEWADFIFAL